jgi:predicted DNA-binding protein
MKIAKPPTSVLTIRVPQSLERRLAAEARRQRRTRSEAARAILEEALGTSVDDPVAAARRQSLRASRQDADADTLAFIEAVADDRGWK